jgi:hypothetical protein
VFLALSIIAPARTALPQSSNNNVLNPPSVTNPLHQTSNFGGDTGSGGFDSILVERRMKMLNNERRKSLVSDSDRLLKLATELNNEIAHSNSGSLTPEQLRKVADIEKLAHGVRDKMVMTIAAPLSLLRNSGVLFKRALPSGSVLCFWGLDWIRPG